MMKLKPKSERKFEIHSGLYRKFEVDEECFVVGGKKTEQKKTDLLFVFFFLRRIVMHLFNTKIITSLEMFLTEHHN